MLCFTMMATQQSSSRKDGFSCEFVEKPPKAIQAECPVCLQILCEPYQAPCCGKSFCRVCIERIKTDNKPCPTCNEENFVIFHNKGLQLSLYEFQIYCSHKQEGCEWKGELGQLDNHLNLSPQPDKQLEGCKYSEIECIYCSELIKRSRVAFHQTEHCDKRPFSCEYCHSYETTYEDVINNHWPVCGYHPVRCPHECGKFLQRQALENHVTKDCPETVIDCDFHHVGCNVKLPHKDMPAHLNENLVTHMSLQAASYSKLLASHKELQTKFHEKVNKLERENETLKQENHQIAIRMEELEQKLQDHPDDEADIQMEVARLHTTRKIPGPANGCFECVMDNYEEYKKSNEKWYSPPFYSHTGGYRFCLGVDAHGSNVAKGNHVSVFFYLMKGDFDDYLKWPFRGQITLQLVDQLENLNHHSKVTAFTDKVSDCRAGRVTHGNRGRGFGKPNFISHRELEPRYLKNDTLCFRVTNIV